jgi:hypothetical protein
MCLILIVSPIEMSGLRPYYCIGHKVQPTRCVL